MSNGLPDDLLGVLDAQLAAHEGREQGVAELGESLRLLEVVRPEVHERAERLRELRPKRLGREHERELLDQLGLNLRARELIAAIVR